MLKTVTRFFLVFTIAVVSSACGIGYQYGVSSHTFAVDESSGPSLPSEEEIEVQTGYHQIRVVDTTGLLLSGLVNTSRQYLARQEAFEEAEDRVDSDGDGKIEVDYEYKPYGIYPGARVIADLRLAAGTPDLTVNGDDFGAQPTYWGLDVLGEFKTFDISWLRAARATLFFAARIDNFDYAETSDPVSFSSLPLDLTFGTAFGYAVIPQVILTGTAEIGFISPLMKAILSDDDTSWINGQLVFEASYYPLDFLAVTANATVGRYSDLTRDVNFGRIGGGLTFEFGNVE